MPNQSITLTRQQLYERIWTEPIDRICGEFGLSNVGLRKLCLRHEIPTPPRGYWAKKEHGHKVKQIPLPPLKNPHAGGSITFDDRPKAPANETSDVVLHPLIEFERKLENAIVVPEDLQARHLLIKATRSYWTALKRHEVHYGQNTLPHLNIRVSEPARPRAYRLMHALFTSWSRPPKFDQVHSGDFDLKIENAWGTRHHWSDGKKQRLEQLLNKVVEGLIQGFGVCRNRQPHGGLQRENIREPKHCGVTRDLSVGLWSNSVAPLLCLTLSYVTKSSIRRFRRASSCCVHSENFDHCTNCRFDGAHVFRTSVTASMYDESARG